MILATWRGDRHSTAAFGRDEQLGATVLGRFLNPFCEVIRKTFVEPHAVSVQYRVEVAGLRDAGTECVGLPANIETITTVRGKEYRQTAQLPSRASQQRTGRNKCETGAKN